MTTIDELNAQFGGEHISFGRGQGDLPVVVLRTFAGQSAEVYLHGASATSWCSGLGHERFFVSKRAMFAPQKPIRGGIPVVFPQFGSGALPPHGFARDREWRVVGADKVGNAPSVTLELISNDETRALWPHEFRCQLRFTLSDALAVNVELRNVDTKPFSFQWAFHTYFRVADISTVAVTGFEGVTFLDSLAARQASVDSRPMAIIAEEVDRIYVQAPRKVEILESGRTTMRVENQGLPDAVLWNPWIDKSKRIADIWPEEYRTFVCVECGLIENPLLLGAGECFRASMRFVPS